MTKTLHYLNSTWWYRLLKTLLILIFIIATIITISRIYEGNSEYKEKDYRITCNKQHTNGSTFLAQKDTNIHILSLNDREYDLHDSLTEEQKTTIRDLCGYTKEEGVNFSNMAVTYLNNHLQDGEKAYDYIYKNIAPYSISVEYISKGGWADIILYSVIALVIIFSLFEIIRRLFYYIVLGTWNPNE